MRFFGSVERPGVRLKGKVQFKFGKEGLGVFFLQPMDQKCAAI
jgi:hypothetical protein